MDVDELSVPVASDVKLNVRRWAGPGRQAFLLVHGLASNARLWDEVAAALAEAGHPVFAVDLRGHGRSDDPPEGYDTATATADLAALTTALGLESAVVAGQSWGGNVTVRFAAEHPAMVQALALIDGGWIDLPARFPSWEACAAALRPADLGDPHVDELRGHLRRAHPDWSPSAIEATVANLRVGPTGRVSRRLPVDRHLAILRSMYDDPPHRFFPALTMPTLLLPAVPAGGGRRAVQVRSRLAQVAAAMPRATLREYEGADHDLHAQHPRRVAADLITLAKEARLS
jgi:pimeloyl-ACP methyl ester carboxylesterase